MHSVNYAELPNNADLGAKVLNTLEHEGVMLLSGSCSLQQFKALSNAVTRDFMPYVGGSNHERKVVDESGRIMTVPGGKHNGPIQLHGEQCYQNSRPDVLFFYCETPAQSGGETIYADGIELYEKISKDSDLKELLTKRVCYHRKRTPDVWKRVYSTQEKQAVIDHCKREGIEATFGSGDVLFTRYVDALVHQSIWTDKQIFINNLLGFARNPRKKGEIYSWITFADNSEIPEHLISRIQKIVAKYTKKLGLKKNDTLILDNRRMLHGRMSFSDENRRLLLRMGLH